MTAAPPPFTDAPAQPSAGGSDVGSPQARADVRFAAALVATLLVVGALLGLVWAWWSPPRMASVVYGNGDLLPDTDSYGGRRQEAWIAGDGRFLVLVVVVGVVAALAAWLLRPRNRGAVVAAALGVGGVGGALLMDLVGYLAGGGDSVGRYRVQLVDGSTERYTKELPLWVHATGLLVVEAAVAVLIYLVLVAFAARDDLGRPDPVRDRLRPQPSGVPAGAEPVGSGGASFDPGGASFGPGGGPAQPGVASVDPGADAQHGRGNGNASGAAQQRQFPPGQFGDAP